MAPEPARRNAPLLVVFNRSSGRGDRDTVGPAVEAACRSVGRACELFPVTQGGQLPEVARQAVQRAVDVGGVVVAAGGDGTINGVAQAVLGSGCAFGVLPRGTFNYFARTHGIPTELDDALQVLLHEEAVPVQVGQVNGRVFLVNASVGLYPKMLADREMASRRFGRKRWVAVAAAVWSLFRPASGRRWRVVMKTHQGAEAQQEEHLVTTLFVGNNPLQLDRMGLPQAQKVADGGHLAVVMLKPQGRWAIARTVWNAATGQLDKDNAVVSMACSELSVAPASWRPPQVKVAFDGEREWMAPPLHFRISARPLWLVAPSQLARDGASQTPPPEEAPAFVPADTLAPGATPAPGLLPA